MGKFKLCKLHSPFAVLLRNTFLGVVLVLASLFIVNLANLNLTQTTYAQDYTTYWTTLATAPTYGDGLSVNTAYLITTPNELAWVALKTNEGTSWSNNLHIMLGANIDLSGYKWKPIGNFNTTTLSSAFTGHFYGNNFEIANMYIDELLDGPSYTGLFGYVDNSIIEEVKLVDVSVSVLDVTILYDTYVGGLVGFVNQSKVLKSSTSGAINVIANQNLFVGGVVGYLNGSTASLEKCYSTAILSASQNIDATTSYVNIGGLVGDSSFALITNSYYKGNVTAKNITAANRINAGGIVGSQQGVGALTINTYVDSIITIDTTGGGKNSNRTGSLIGYLQSSEIRASFYNATTQDLGKNGVGASSSGTITIAEAKTAYEMTLQATFEPLGNEWDFANIWVMDTLNINAGQPIFGDIGNSVIFATSNINNGISPVGILLSSSKITQNYTFNNYGGYQIGAIIVNDVAIDEYFLLDVFYSSYVFNLASGFNTIYAEYYFEGTITITAVFDQTTNGGVEINMTPFIKITSLASGSTWLVEVANNLNKTIIVNEESDFEITFINPTNHSLNYALTSPTQTSIFTLNLQNPNVQINLTHTKTNLGYIYNSYLS